MRCLFAGVLWAAPNHDLTLVDAEWDAEGTWCAGAKNFTSKYRAFFSVRRGTILGDLPRRRPVSSLIRRLWVTLSSTIYTCRTGYRTAPLVGGRFCAGNRGICFLATSTLLGLATSRRFCFGPKPGKSYVMTSVQVVARIRPLNEREKKSGSTPTSLS